MLPTLRDLVAHKGHANAAMLNAIRQSSAATADAELWDLLHHILLANRFWLLTVLGLPFVVEEESRPSTSLDALVQRYARLQAQEAAWLDVAPPDEPDRILEGHFIPGGQCSVAQAYLQVCLHSHGHRAQMARMLRRHGGAPPGTDFIAWLVERPGAKWSAALEAEPTD